MAGIAHPTALQDWITLMQSKNLCFEPLTAAHADDLFAILTAPAVLAFIEAGNPPTLEELRVEYADRSRGAVNSTMPITSGRLHANEQWFNMMVRLPDPEAVAIGRLEATWYGEWGELAYIFGQAWWGKGLAFEAMCWWHDYLDTAVPRTQWWATVHPANHRSIQLLMRLGYEEVDSSDRSQLQSYDPGDRCFVRSIL
jgi:RimJ/RimL family protein N-acetyltransferase